MEVAQKIMPTTYFIAMLVLSIVLHFIYPIKKVLYPPFTYTGFLLILFGAAINLWTDWLFKRHETPVKPYLEPESLITSGPFRISRHPMYLGMTSVLLGVTLVHGTVVTFPFPIFYVVLMEVLFIPFEEENLVKIFGKEYLDYKHKVRRWI